MLPAQQSARLRAWRVSGGDVLAGRRKQRQRCSQQRATWTPTAIPGQDAHAQIPDGRCRELALESVRPSHDSVVLNGDELGDVALDIALNESLKAQAEVPQ